MAVIAPEREDLKKQEQQAPGDDFALWEKELSGGGFRYNPEEGPEKPGALTKIKGSFKGKGKRVWLLGGVGGGLIIAVLLIFFMLGSFLIPHFFSNMIGYRFAGEARIFRQANEQILSRSLMNDSMTDEEYKKTESKYKSLYKWATMQKYRPAAIMRELRSTGRLNFSYEPITVKNFFRPRKVTAIIVNGESIPIGQTSKWGIPFSGATNNLRLSASVDEALFRGWKGTSGSVGAVLRTSVGSQILQEAGVSGWYAWANKAKDYKNLTAEEADVKELRRQYSKASVKPTSSLVKNISDGAEEADKKLTESVNDPKTAKEMVKNPDQLPKNVGAAIVTATGSGILEKAISATSTAAAIGIPLCMVFDGSLESSGPTIDARAATLQKQFIDFGSAAHQQQAGAVTGEAIGAFNRKVNRDGGIGRSDLQKILSGQAVDTRESLTPQSGLAGEYSLLNLAFSPEVASQMNEYAIPVCSTVSSVWFGLLTGGLELGLGFFTGGASAGVEKLATTAGAKAIGKYIAEFGRSLLTKKTAKKFVAQGGAIAGATLYARMLVAEHANLDYEAINAGEKFANNVDAGATITAAETNRALMGAPLTDEAAIESKNADRLYNAEQLRRSSFTERYLSLQNSASLASRVADSLVINASINSLGSMFSKLGSLFNPFVIMSTFNRLAPSVSAASVIDMSSYTVTSWGDTTEETNAINTREDYHDMFINDAILDSTGKKDEIADKYGQCYSNSMGTLLSKGLIKRQKNGKMIADTGNIDDCSPKNLGMKNPKYDDLVFRWRMSKRIDKVMTSGQEISEPTNTISTVSSGRISGQGDVASLAQQVLERQGKTIMLSGDALRDVQNATNIGICGVKSLHPAILQLLLALTDPTKATYYTVGISNFVSGRGGCDSGQHPLGRAMDVSSINGTIVRVNNSAQNPDEERAFIKKVASLMPEGVGGIGQKECSVVSDLDLAPAQFFNDNGNCDHFHIDVRNAP